MHFPTTPSPHLAPTNSVSRIMLLVLLAMIPGILAQWWQFGPGVLVNLGLALVTAEIAEATVLILRRRPVLPALLDGSAALTAALLAVALPPLAPWWLTVFGALFAIIIAKQIYGGLGYNPFNPAMVGYAVLLISFPRYMTAWLPPADLATTSLSLSDAAVLIFQQVDKSAYDGLAQATPLDSAKTQLGLSLGVDEILSGQVFGALGGKGWQWVNLGYLLGGLWLLRKQVIAWQIPAGFLAGLFVSALLFFLFDSAANLPPLFHLFSGATMLGAFFIATDPVSASTTPRGRLIYGGLIGFLVIVIRVYGGYPDGVAFAVLLLNLAAPTLDHYTRPRVYGHAR
ncbi:electron transport complex subunit RsxD [Methylococcus sp. EFPC2]|uniref:electron transport complex subunit RsxD n=1 Tax=Methylococcus sp. EFPC2 TaxID=2812648 RepID=UPI00196752DF|nr:electron transport complex subunit RsxD [Methylococcus sp. EFPC2]QSA96901.1 electron transport complex subunit RsxD [Methylococcus sp. EFPC2]